MQPIKPKIATENNLPKISKGPNLIETLTRFYMILSRLPPFLLQWPVPRQHSRDPIDPSNLGVLASWWRKSRCHRPGCGCHLRRTAKEVKGLWWTWHLATFGLIPKWNKPFKPSSYVSYVAVFISEVLSAWSQPTAPQWPQRQLQVQYFHISD